jgi:hypothetical protein
MIDETTQLLALIAKKSTVVPLVGTFVSATATGCTVDVGGGRIPAQFGTSYLPEVNEAVWVLFIDGTPFMIGPTSAKAGQGTVVSVAAGLATLTTAFGTIAVPYASTLTPTAGQIMKLSWQGGGFGIAVMSNSPAGGVAPPAPSSGAVTHVDTFTAGDAGSHQSSGWWTPKVYASDSNLSAWWYGSKISDTVPAAAVVSKVEVYISAQQIQGASPNFALHADLSKPGGAPTLTSSTAVAVSPGWVTLPLAFGNALKKDGGSYGVGLNHGGYSIFNSLTTDGQSGALRITSTY